MASTDRAGRRSGDRIRIEERRPPPGQHGVYRTRHEDVDGLHLMATSVDLVFHSDSCSGGALARDSCLSTTLILCRWTLLLTGRCGSGFTCSEIVYVVNRSAVRTRRAAVAVADAPGRRVRFRYDG